MVKKEKMKQWLPGSDPRLGVHVQAAAPEAVLLRAGGQETPLLCKLLSQGTDVIGLKATAASDVTNASVVSFPGVFLHIPSGQSPGLQSCRRTQMYV